MGSGKKTNTAVPKTLFDLNVRSVEIPNNFVISYIFRVMLLGLTVTFLLLVKFFVGLVTCTPWVSVANENST